MSKAWQEILPADLHRAEEAIVLTDCDGNIVWANTAFLRLTEYAFADVLGKKPGSLLQGKDTDHRIVEAMRDAIRLGHEIAVQVRNYTKQGKPYDVLLALSPLLDEKGVVQNFVAVSRDVTGANATKIQATRACVLSRLAEMVLIYQTIFE